MIRMCLIALAICAVTQSAQAQSVIPCDSPVARAQNIMGPDQMRTFANGNIRLIGLDVVEPATGWAYLMVTTLVAGTGQEACVVIGRSPGLGYSGMYFDSIEARYDAAIGLTILITMQEPDNAGGFYLQDLGIIVNQATGSITARAL